jgi:hypothetical protein
MIMIMITIMSLWIAAIAMLLFLGALSVRKVHRKIWCPIRGTEVQLSLLETAPEGRPLEVTACSAVHAADRHHVRPAMPGAASRPAGRRSAPASRVIGSARSSRDTGARRGTAARWQTTFSSMHRPPARRAISVPPPSKSNWRPTAGCYSTGHGYP